MIKVQYAVISDVGSKRSNNEDIAYADGKLIRDGEGNGEIDLRQGIAAFAVADGMGGYEGGEVASEIVARSFSSLIRHFEYEDDDNVIMKLKDWAAKANRLVIETASLRPELSEMGSTFIGALVLFNQLFMLNVGDSRCYRWRQGTLKQLSTDHSERERRGDSSIPSNIIYNFMGIDPSEFISDISVLSPHEGDTYMLCSDGLSDLIPFEELESAFLSSSGCKPPESKGLSDDDYSKTQLALTEISKKLVAMAKEEGGRDNITVLIFTIS